VIDGTFFQNRCQSTMKGAVIPFFLALASRVVLAEDWDEDEGEGWPEPTRSSDPDDPEQETCQVSCAVVLSHIN
jgi:hypothetical protein